jgi:hypothetical protein
MHENQLPVGMPGKTIFVEFLGEAALNNRWLPFGGVEFFD